MIDYLRIFFFHDNIFFSTSEIFLIPLFLIRNTHFKIAIKVVEDYYSQIVEFEVQECPLLILKADQTQPSVSEKKI